MTDMPPPAPLPPPSGPKFPPPSGPPSEGPGLAARPWFKRKRILLPTAALCLLVIAGAIAGEGTVDEPLAAATSTSTAPKEPRSDRTTSTTARARPTTTAPRPTTPPPTAPPTTADPFAGESVSQRNARRKAADYLQFSAFSRSGLIKQLEYEGFSQADSTYGVDSLNADWMEQAALKAKDYMEFSAFSRSGLIEQLKYEGFSQAEAEHGADSVGL